MVYELFFAIALFLIPIIIIGLIRKRAARDELATIELQNTLNQRSFADVKNEVESLLDQLPGWNVEGSETTVSTFDAATNTFFSKYQYISDDGGSVCIDASAIQPSARKDFLVIGSSFEGDQILLEKETGRVVWIGIGEQPEQGFQFTSIYHLLLHELLISRE